MSALFNFFAHLVVGIIGIIVTLVSLAVLYWLVVILIDDIKEQMKRSKKK